MFSRSNIHSFDNPVFRKAVLVLLMLFLSACTQTTISQSAQVPVGCSRGLIITAINRANDDPDPSILVLEQDCEIFLYTEDNHEGIHGANALPLITTPITILGNNAVLDGSGIRLFYITSEGSLRLEDLILDHGGANVLGDTTGPGGGLIVNEGGVLTLHNVILQNTYGTVGGAIWNSGSMIIEEGTVFENNRAGLGGAIFIAGSAGIPISITDTTFTRNIADTNFWGDYGIGGAIYVEGTDGAGLQISDTTISSSKAIYKGGAIYSEDPTGDIMIYNSHLGGNKSFVDGGAIYLETGAMSIVDSSFASNSSGYYSTTSRVPTDVLPSGGDIYLLSGSLDITGSDASGSKADYEGGFLLNKGGDVRILGSKISRGSTNFVDRHHVDYPSFGGCISNYNTLMIQYSSIQDCQSFAGGGLINHTQGSAVLTNITMNYNNTVMGFGGHIYNRGGLDLNFVTLKDSVSDDGDIMYLHGGITRIKDSIIYNSSYMEIENLCIISEGIFEPVGENYIYGGECLGFSPQDSNLVDRFGTYYYDLEMDSPALDGASSCLDLNGNTVGFDQIGIRRPQPVDGQCDSGAIEMPQPPGPPPPAPTPQIMPRLSTPENLSCREGDSNDYPVAGYLMAGETAEVIAQNQAGTWLVINNPDWEGVCWLFEGNVVLEGSLEGVVIFTAPPLSKVEEPAADDDDSTDLVCTSDLIAEECKKAGGTYDLNSLPPCKCP